MISPCCRLVARGKLIAMLAFKVSSTVVESIGGAAASQLPAVQTAGLDHTLSIADRFDQLLGAEGFLQERAVLTGIGPTVLPDMMMMFICGCRRRAY